VKPTLNRTHKGNRAELWVRDIYQKAGYKVEKARCSKGVFDRECEPKNRSCVYLLVKLLSDVVGRKQPETDRLLEVLPYVTGKHFVQITTNSTRGRIKAIKAVPWDSLPANAVKVLVVKYDAKHGGGSRWWFFVKGEE